MTDHNRPLDREAIERDATTFARAYVRGDESAQRFIGDMLAAMRANPGGSFLGAAKTISRFQRGILGVKAKGTAPLRIKVRNGRGTPDPRAAWIKSTTAPTDTIDRDRDLAIVVLAWHNATGKARKRADDTLRAACHKRGLDPVHVKATFHDSAEFRKALCALI